MHAFVLALLVLVCIPGIAYAEGTELDIGLTGTAGYDSNPRAIDVAREPDFRYSITPKVDLEGRWRRLSYNLNTNSSYVGFAKATERNRWVAKIKGGAGYDIASYTTLWVQNQYRNFDGAVGAEGQSVAEAAARDYLNTTIAGIRHRFSPRGIFEGNVSYTRVQRENRNRYSARYYGADLRYKHTLNSRDTIVARGGYVLTDLVEPENPELNAVPTAMSHTVEGTVGWTHEFSRKFQIELEVGPNFLHQSLSEPVLDAPVRRLYFADRPQLRPRTNPDARSDDAVVEVYPTAAGDAYRLTLQGEEPDGAPEVLNGEVLAPSLYTPALSTCEQREINGQEFRIFVKEDGSSGCGDLVPDVVDDPEFFAKWGNVSPFKTHVLPGNLYDGTRQLGTAFPDPSGEIDGGADGRWTSTGNQFLIYDYRRRDLESGWDYADGAGQTGFDFCDGDCLDPTPVWYPHFLNQPTEEAYVFPDDDPANAESRDVFDGFNTALQPDAPTTSFTPGRIPILTDPDTPDVVSQWSFVVKAGLKRSWERAEARLNFTHTEEPDQASTGDTSIDRLALHLFWKPTQDWRVEGRTSYAWRRSATETPDFVIVAGALTDLNGNLVRAQQLVGMALSPQPALDFALPDGSYLGNNPRRSLVPVAAGYVQVGRSRGIDVKTFRLNVATSYRLTRWSSARLNLGYINQASDGRYYRTYNRFDAVLSYTYHFDPIRF